MPDEEQPNSADSPKEGEVVENRADKKEKQKPQVSEAFEAGMMRIFGEQDTYKPTKSQVDKMLSLQEKGMDYTHKERTMWQPRQVAELVSFILLLIFVTGLIWLILDKAPQYTGEVISVVIGLVGGGLGGYGYGSKKNKSQDE